MKRLRLITRVLSAVVLALSARMIADGLTPTIAVTTGAMVVLLAASLGLERQGRRLEPASSDPTAELGRATDVPPTSSSPRPAPDP